MSRISGNFNFAANLEVLAKAPLDAKQKVDTYLDLTNPTTWNQSGEVWLYNGAIVTVANDSDASNNGIYWLCDAANYTNPDSWIKSGVGSGTITGATNGLFVTNSGTTIALGGNLTSGTTISGAGLYELNIQNISGFNVSTPSDTTQLILEPAGITLSYSGTSVSLDSNAGLEYDGNYRSNFNEYSLPDVGYLTGITSTKLNTSDFNTYSGTTAPNTFLKLDQSTPQTVINSQPIFDEGIKLGTSPSISQISGHTKGKIYYDSCYQTLSADIGNDEVTLQLGQETLRYVYNSTGSVIPDGSPVYITGVHTGGIGEPDVISIGLAIATGSTKSVVIGVTTQVIQINSYGYITVGGAINNLNTLTTNPYSGMTAGDIIYLSPTIAGGVTNIAPTTPSVEIILGRLIKKGSTDGKIYVNINPAYSLNDLTDVTVLSPTVDDVLKWNGSEWVNATVGAVSAGAGVIFYNATPIINSRTAPAGISSTGAGNGVQIGTLSKTPITTPTSGCTISGQAVSDTRFFSAWLYDQPLGRDVIDAGVWKSITYIAVDSVGGGSLTCAGRGIYQVVPISGSTISVTGVATNARTATISSSQFAGTYFSASTINTNASWLQTPSGIYQICDKIDNNNICIVVPTGYGNETTVTGNTWNRLFNAASDVITSIYPTFATCEVSMTLPAFDVSCTDKLGQMGYVISNNTRTIYMTYNGLLTASYFQTPLITLHNDLAGLQGGSGTERFHINLDKYNVVQNTSGTNTGDETKETIESKLTGEIFSHYHPYSGLTGKPDLNIYQTISGFTGYTASTEPIISNAITGITYVGDGNIIPYTGITNRNIVFNTIKGSGSTIVNKIGNNIIIYSSGATGSEYVFDYNIQVSIADGKTFGKYENGDIIPSSGKTAVDVIKMALSEALEPTVNLSSSSNNVVFGESGKTVNLSFSYTINTLGATVQSAILEWRRNNTGVWTTLTTTTATPTGYTHNIDDSSDRFNSTQINYRYTVVDSAGATGQITHNVTPQAYAAPSMSIVLGGTITSPETQNSREKGNVISSPSGSITSNRSLVDITDWTLERRYNGGSWLILASGSTLETQSVTVPSTLDNTIPTSATSIDYRLTYVDEYTSGTGGAQAINFFYYSYYGYDPNTVLNESEIEALENKVKLSNQNLTWNDINSPVGNYTYYSFPTTYSNITQILRTTPAPPETTAWQNLSSVSVTNTYGEVLNYRVWRTNATNAYTGVGLIFS